MLRPSKASVIALCTFAAGVFSACTSLTVRKDWRSLTENERQDFITAQQTLWRQSIDPMTGYSVYDRNFTMLHRANTPYAHNMPQFLPWHRRFLRDYEAALRTVNPSVSLPYWNWADEDYPHLNKSLIWSDAYFGGDGDETDPNHCVKTGRYANWPLSLGGDLKDPSIDIKHCLRRIWDRGINVYFPPGETLPVPNTAEIAGNITECAGNFTLFRDFWEFPHGTIHLGVGGFSETLNGDMTAVENSPNEPIFWLHHTFVDRVWWLFQKSSSEARSAYGGFPSRNAHIPKNDSAWTTEATMGDMMKAWNVSVESAFYADADGYCYTYM